MNAQQRGDAAEQLLDLVLDMACALRVEAPAAIHAQLRAMDRLTLEQALVVALACVDVQQSPGRLLAWITWDEHGRPLPPGPPPVSREQAAAHRRQLLAGLEEARRDKAARAAHERYRRRRPAA